MAVDPKVVGGGAAVVAIGGGSGYAISQAVDSSKDNQDAGSTSGKNTPQPTLKPEKKTENKNVNKTALTAAGFQVDSTKEDETKCKEKLENEILSTEEDFKGAVKECVVGKKFADKAEALGLDVLKSSNGDNWITDWSTYKTSIATIITESSGKNNWSDAKSDVISFCTESSSDKGNKEINESIADTDWKNFLTACTKDKTINSKKVTVAEVKTKNFWTGK